MAGIIKKEQADLKRTAKRMGDDPSTWEGWVSNVFTGIFGTLSEGTAVFIEKRYSTKIRFELSKIEKMKELMVRMSLEKDKSKEADIFDEEFSKDSDHGEYYLGYMMSYFIALTFLKRKGRLANVKVFKGLFSNEECLIPFTRLQEYLMEHRSVKFAPLDPEVFQMAHQELSAIRNYVDFIKRYESACNELGLKEPIKFFSLRFVEELKANYYKKTEYLRTD